MADIVIAVQGDGMSRFHNMIGALGEHGEVEMLRGLISGGRKLTTKVRRALAKQTGIKYPVLTKKVTGYHTDAGRAWVIKGQGKGVRFSELRDVRTQPLAPRNPQDQPRDDLGRFTFWPDPMRERGRVTARVWNVRKRFAWSLYDQGVFKTTPPDSRVHTMFGPAPWKELVKDQSLAAWKDGATPIQHEIERRLVKLSGGALSRG